MTKLIPVLTEKSLEEAKKGNYTFWVDRGWNKFKIKRIVDEVFGVNAVKVRTINYVGRIKKDFRGKKKVIKPRKKAMVTLKGKEEIDLFESKK